MKRMSEASEELRKEFWQIYRYMQSVTLKVLGEGAQQVMVIICVVLALFGILLFNILGMLR